MNSIIFCVQFPQHFYICAISSFLKKDTGEILGGVFLFLPKYSFIPLITDAFFPLPSFPCYGVILLSSGTFPPDRASLDEPTNTV